MEVACKCKQLLHLVEGMAASDEFLPRRDTLFGEVHIREFVRAWIRLELVVLNLTIGLEQRGHVAWPHPKHTAANCNDQPMEHVDSQN